MTQPGPLDTINNLAAAINRGDLAVMLNLFEPEVVQALAGQQAQITRGHAAIRNAYTGFFH